MEVQWAPQASDDYDFWLANDGKIAQRIRDLIADIQRDPFRGIGKPVNP
jgi:toxin YoeB